MHDLPTFDFDIGGVTFQSAKDWIEGKVWARHVSDLDGSKPEVIFLNELGNRASYRNAMLATVALWDAGCRGAIAHATSPIMQARYKRQGGIVAITETAIWRGEEHTAQRIIIPPAAMLAWVNKVRSNLHPTGHVPAVCGAKMEIDATE